MHFWGTRIASHGENCVKIADRLNPKKLKVRLRGKNSFCVEAGLVCSKSMIIEVNGYGNSIYLKGDGSMPSVHISIDGDGNEIIVGEHFNNENPHRGELHISIRGCNNHVTLSNRIEVVSLLDIDLCEIADMRNVFIGQGSTFYKTSIQVYDPTSSVIVGDDCMFSYDTTIYNTDGHAIFQDGRLINKAETCQLGNRVWVGWGATVLKNSMVAHGTIIGRAALVTGKFEQENTAIGGVPARIIKENVIWSRNSVAEVLRKGLLEQFAAREKI